MFWYPLCLRLDFGCSQQNSFWSLLVSSKVSQASLFLSIRWCGKCFCWLEIHLQTRDGTLALSVPTCTSPYLPPLGRGGEVHARNFCIYLPTSPPSFKNKILISNWLKKLCYLDNTIISYSDFFTYFNVISWINYVYYFYITNLMFNFCNNSLHVISLMSLMFISFL